VERDQRGIGRDLHDGLSQHLAATAMVSYAHAQKLALSGQPEVERARKIVALIEQSIALARSISQGLHPIEMGGDALMHGLEEFASTTSELFGIRCRLDCQLPVIVDNSTSAMHLFRIVQEAVSNSIRHGRATEIEILLSECESGINVSVLDNGTGVPMPTSNRKGLGLHIMAARAKFIGGKLSLGRRMSGGTEVICQVPFSQ
jgi:signal transduction histidine kinase